MANISSILDRPASEIEAPKPLPVGTYLAVIKGLPRYDKSSKKQTDFVEFSAVIQQAMDDVDQEALEEYLTKGDGTKGSLSDRPVKLTYYVTEDASWRLKKFLQDLGFDMDDPEVTLRQACESSAGSSVYLTMKHRASEDGKSIFAEVKDTAKVD